MMRLKAFGGPVLTHDHVVIEGSGAVRRRLAFLTSIACAGSTGTVSRDRLLLLFWPERTDAQARNALKQMTFALRRDLGAPELFLGTTDLRLNPAVITSDVMDFVDAEASNNHKGVVAAYSGPLLDGVHLTGATEFDSWLDDQRRRFSTQFRASVSALVEAAQEEGRTSDGIRYLETLTQQDPLDSSTARRLVEALAAAKRMSDAIRIGRQYELMVRRELNVGIDPAFAALIRELRRQLESSSDGPAVSNSPRGAVPQAIAVADEVSEESVPRREPGTAQASFVRSTVQHPDPRTAAYPQPLQRSRFEQLHSRTTAIAVGVMIVLGLSVLAYRGHVTVSKRPLGSARSQVYVPQFEAATDSVSRTVAAMATENVDALLEQLGNVSIVRRSPLPGEQVDMVVHGRYRQVGSVGHLSVELAPSIGGVASRTTVDVVPLGKNLGDSLSLIAGRVQAAVAASTPVSDELPMLDRSARPSSYEAYAVFEDARNKFYLDDCRAAHTRFATAAALDPGFTMAAIYVARSSYCAGEFTRAAAELAALQTLRLLPYDRAYIEVLANRFEGDWPAQERASLRMLRLAPGSEFALATAIGACLRAGELTRADSLIRYGPLRARLTDVGYLRLTYHALNDHARELQYLDAMIRQFPRDNRLLAQEAMAFAAMHRPRDVNERLVHLRSDGGRPIGEWMRETAAEFSTHDQPSEAVALLRRAVEWYRLEPAVVSAAAVNRIAYGMALLDAREFDAAEVVLAHVDTTEIAELDKITRIGARGVLAARLKRPQFARLNDSWLEKRPLLYVHGYPYVWRSRIALALGDTLRATDYLRLALQHGFPVYYPEGPYDALHGVPELQHLLFRPGIRELLPASAQHSAEMAAKR